MINTNPPFGLKNNTGPKIVSCGIPLCSEKKFNLTLCFLTLKKDVIQLITVVLTLLYFKFCIRRLVTVIL